MAGPAGKMAVDGWETVMRKSLAGSLNQSHGNLNGQRLCNRRSSFAGIHTFARSVLAASERAKNSRLDRWFA
jgi:hypothetical protein